MVPMWMTSNTAVLFKSHQGEIEADKVKGWTYPAKWDSGGKNNFMFAFFFFSEKKGKTVLDFSAYFRDATAMYFKWLFSFFPKIVINVSSVI